MNKLMSYLSDEGGIKGLLKQIRCWLRGGHDWQDGGDWFFCSCCTAMQKLPNTKVR